MDQSSTPPRSDGGPPPTGSTAAEVAELRARATRMLALANTAHKATIEAAGLWADLAAASSAMTGRLVDALGCSTADVGNPRSMDLISHAISELLGVELGYDLLSAIERVAGDATGSMAGDAELDDRRAGDLERWLTEVQP